MNKTINQYINQLHLDPKREAAVRKLIQSVSQSSGGSNGGSNTPEPEFVDLGLPSGTLWCSCNLGANNPEEFGDLYAWGDDTPYKLINPNGNGYAYHDKDGNSIDNVYEYCFTNYKHSIFDVDSGSVAYTKYIYKRDIAAENTILDYKWKLDIVDDITKKYNPNWSMPSPTQIKEIVDLCNKEIYEDKIIFTSKVNGNNIIFKLNRNAGPYIIWSNELGFYNYYESDPSGAGITLMLNRFNNTVEVGCYEGYGYANRQIPLCVRPVINSYIESNIQVVYSEEYLYSKYKANGLFYAKLCYSFRNKLPFILGGGNISAEVMEINDENLDIEKISIYNHIQNKEIHITKDLAVTEIS